MAYLLDADWAIRALARDFHIISTLDRLAPEGIALTWITLGEIYEGAFGHPDPQAQLDRFRRFLSGFPVLDLDASIMERFAQLRAMLRRRGQLVPDFDLLLAATAICYDLVVLTSNVRHLERIPGIRIYRQE